MRTTDSQHGLVVHPHLVPELTVNGLDQLWVADITYIRLQQEFIYLAVLLDAFSRRCIGWALDRTLEAELALAALRPALAARTVRPGLVHHSDRGVQYASHAYTNLLQQKQIRISMSRRGNPYDNAQAESFITTLKYEEVYLFEYRNLGEARSRIGHFLEDVYNQKRLHSALGCLPPAEFEQLLFEPTYAQLIVSNLGFTPVRLSMRYLGMGAAFLQAGVGTFIGTLYPLSDEGSSRLERRGQT